MKKVVGKLSVVYGVGLSIYFGSWALRDNAALEVAVKADIPSRELRHRINVFSEGVWFLMSNMIVLQGVSMISDNTKKED
jgi:predicted metalloprotease